MFAAILRGSSIATAHIWETGEIAPPGLGTGVKGRCERYRLNNLKKRDNSKIFEKLVLSSTRPTSLCNFPEIGYDHKGPPSFLMEKLKNGLVPHK